MRQLPRTARLMVLPAALFLLVLVGMAISASPDPEFNPPTNSGPTNQSQSDFDPSGTRSGGDNEGESEPPSITIESDQGTIEVRFDSDGVARLSADGETELDLVQGTNAGVRLGEDGQLEPVPPAIVEDGDLGLTATDQGIEVHSPGTPSIELRPDGVQGGVSATEFDGESVTNLTPENGIVELADGTTISPIEAPASSVVAAEPAAPMPWRWIFSIIAFVAVVSAATGYLLHRNYTERDLRVASIPTTTGVDENFEQFLARLAADHNPTRAVRLGFHAVENGLGGLPVRRDDETPFEWHQRVASAMPAMNEPVGRICDLFARARFAPGHSSEADRQQMIEEIRALFTGGASTATAANVGSAAVSPVSSGSGSEAGV